MNIARQIESQMMVQARAGILSSSVGQVPYLCDFSVRFLAFVAEMNRDEETKQYYRNGWRLIKDSRLAKMKLDAITPSMISTLHVSGSGSNMNNALRTLRRMLNLAKEWGVLNNVPRIHLVQEVERTTVISPVDELTVLAKASATVRDAFVLSIDCGLRPFECVAIDLENDVDFVTRIIIVRRGKGGKKRIVAMTDRVYEILVRRAALGYRWAFPSTRQKRKDCHIHGQSLTTAFCELKRELGLPRDVVLYSARHTFGTDFADATGNLVKLKTVMGHSDVKITQRYVHVAGAKEAASVMDNRNRERHNLSHSTFPVQ